jgi:hypothetical protein
MMGLFCGRNAMQRLSARSVTAAARSVSRSASSTSAASSVVLIDGIRLPFTLAGTAYKDLLAVDLGRLAMKGILDKTALDPKLVSSDFLSLRLCLSVSLGLSVSILTLCRSIIFIMEQLFKKHEQVTLLVSLPSVLGSHFKYQVTL